MISRERAMQRTGRVRSLTEADVATCAWAEPPRQLLAHIDRSSDGDADCLALIVAEEIVAVSAVVYAHDHGLLRTFAVHPDLRGIGVGRRFLDELHRRVRDRRLPVMRMTARTDGELYRWALACGYTCIRSVDDFTMLQYDVRPMHA